MWRVKEGGGKPGVVYVQSANSRDRIFTSRRCLDFHREGTSAFKWELHCSRSSNESDVATKTPGARFSPKICLPWLRSLGRWPAKPSLFHPPSRMNDQSRRVSRILVAGYVEQGLLHSRIVLESCLALPRPRLASPPYRFLVTSGSCERPAGQERKGTPIYYFSIHRTRRRKSTHFDDGTLW
jgi:hypothetical protein